MTNPHFPVFPCLCRELLLTLAPSLRRRFVLVRQVRRVARFNHRCFCHCARLLRSVLQDVPCQLGVGFVPSAPLLHGSEHLPQTVSHPTLALDASDAGCAAALVDLSHSFRAAEYLVQVTNWA